MFPVEGQVSVATLPQQSEVHPEQSSEWSRDSNCVSPGASDETMSDRVSLCYGSASDLSQSISDASMPDPEENAPMDGPLSGECLTAFSVPNRGSGRAGALQPKLNDDQRAQTVTGLACKARPSREAPGCVSRIWRKHPAGTARAVAGSAA